MPRGRPRKEKKDISEDEGSSFYYGDCEMCEKCESSFGCDFCRIKEQEFEIKALEREIIEKQMRIDMFKKRKRTKAKQQMEDDDYIEIIDENDNVIKKPKRKPGRPQLYTDEERKEKKKAYINKYQNDRYKKDKIYAEMKRQNTRKIYLKKVELEKRKNIDNHADE